LEEAFMTEARSILDVGVGHEMRVLGAGQTGVGTVADAAEALRVAALARAVDVQEAVEV
jgi:hypothetical protein